MFDRLIGASIMVRQFIIKWQRIILIAGLLYYIYIVASGLFNDNYVVILISLILILWLLALLNQKAVFLIFMLLVPFSFIIKLAATLLVSGMAASLIGIYKDLLLFYLLTAIVSINIVKKRYVFKLNRLDIPIFVYIGYCLVNALINSSSLTIGLVGLRKMLIFTGVYFITRTLIKKEEDVRLLMKCVLGIGFVVALGAIVQWLFLPEWMSVATLAGGQKLMSGRITGYYLVVNRAMSFMESPNVLGFYLAYLAAIVIGMLGYLDLKKKNLSAFIIYGIIAVTILTGLLFSMCRGGWIALFIALVIWGAMKFRYLSKKLFIIAVILLTAALIILNNPLLKFRLTSTFDPEDWSRQSRITKVFSTYAINLDDPKAFFVGKGIGSVGAVPDAFMSDEMVKNNFIDMYYLELYADVGIIGLGIFLWLLFSYIKYLFLAERTTANPYYKQILNGLIIATITFALSGFFTGVGASFEEATLFWAFIGITTIIGAARP
jgi:putative inorganic carbon (hco3(-)) transporter